MATTNTKDTNGEPVLSSPTNSHEDIKSHSYRRLPPDTELLSAPDEQEEEDLDESTASETPEQQYSLPPHTLSNTSPPASTPLRPWSDFSQATTATPHEKTLSRSYRFVQLEKALILAKLIESFQDRMKFKNDYQESLRENKFEEFLKTYYKKLEDHHEKVKQEHKRKMTRAFTFVDLEKNFLARDPTRDIKILFIDDPIRRLTGKVGGALPAYYSYLNYTNSSASHPSNDIDIESFYENRLDHFLQNPSEGREEIILFSRRAGELLHERLPRLSRVPHRVDIVDQRESKGDYDERTLLQMKHKQTLSIVAHRRQLLKKMMTQAKKNQTRMDKFNAQTSSKIHNTAYFRQLFHDLNAMEPSNREQQVKRPQTSYKSRKMSSSTYSLSWSDIVTRK